MIATLGSLGNGTRSSVSQLIYNVYDFNIDMMNAISSFTFSGLKPLTITLDYESLSLDIINCYN